MEKLCRELGFECWYVTSAKKGSNVEDAFEYLAHRMQVESVGSGNKMLSNKVDDGRRLETRKLDMLPKKRGCPCA